jgi:hypothetical protein
MRRENGAATPGRPVLRPVSGQFLISGLKDWGVALNIPGHIGTRLTPCGGDCNLGVCVWGCIYFAWVPRLG